MSDDELQQALEALLRRTGKAHHQAYIETDGYHPEWAEWYAEYAGEELGRLLDYPFDQDELAGLFEELDRQHRQEAGKSDWVGYYAAVMMERYLS